VTPLGELLHCADRARQGDFSRRTRFAGTDELGRLGAAMNLMTEGLYEIYNELEERVAAKTRDLARTNHSLELLYRTSRMINESPVSEPVLRRVLDDVRNELRLAEAVLCLRDGDAVAAGDCIAAGPEAEDRGCGDHSGECQDSACRLCAAPWPLTDPDQAGVLSFPVADQHRCFGTLRVLPRPGRRLATWQQPLLEAVAGQMATALNLQSRMRESRRLMLHEERSILARELHDSLAQSLSYLKIQAARLDVALRDASAQTSADNDLSPRAGRRADYEGASPT
jgi:two-component system nitrate/nitrite sensor histidine kinase NarX